MFSFCLFFLSKIGSPQQPRVSILCKECVGNLKKGEKI